MTSPPPPSPFWIIVAALIGAGASLLAQLVAHLLNRGRENRRFRLESYRQFRAEFIEDQELRNISRKSYAEFTAEETERYLDFFEDMGLYWARKLIDLDLIDECFGDYVIDCYQNDDIMKYVGAVRGEQRDPSYWEHFENLAKELLRRQEERRKKSKNADERAISQEWPEGKAPVAIEHVDRGSITTQEINRRKLIGQLRLGLFRFKTLRRFLPCHLARDPENARAGGKQGRAAIPAVMVSWQNVWLDGRSV